MQLFIVRHVVHRTEVTRILGLELDSMGLAGNWLLIWHKDCRTYFCRSFLRGLKATCKRTSEEIFSNSHSASAHAEHKNDRYVVNRVPSPLEGEGPKSILYVKTAQEEKECRDEMEPARRRAADEELAGDRARVEVLEREGDAWAAPAPLQVRADNASAQSAAPPRPIRWASRACRLFAPTAARP